MIADVRKLLRRKLPPRMYRHVDSFWWLIRHRLPRFVASLTTGGSPQILGTAGISSSRLVDQIRKINVVGLTQLCYIMLRNGSDKGWGLHNYTTVYSALFHERRNESLRIFELGLGSNNPDMPFYMGEDGTPGASLRGWREFFPSALVFGADIDRGILFEEDRIQTFYCDQLDEDVIRDLWSQPALGNGLDIIIDDGHHTLEANTLFLAGSLGHLNPGGIYIVEDINKATVPEWKALLETTYPNLYPEHEFALIELPHPLNGDDNTLLVVRKHL